MADRERPRSGLSQASSVLTISSISLGATKPARPLRRIHTFAKREHSIKRDPNAPVVMRGWLCKQDSSGLKLWKRRWFVLADYCLFYYRDSREEAVWGSIPLPSYEIRPLAAEGKSRKFIFKAEHRGMRTYYFSADTQEDMNGWIRAMSRLAAAESYPSSTYGSSRPPQAQLLEGTRPPTPDLGSARSLESLEIAQLGGAHSSVDSLCRAGRGAQGEEGSPSSGPAPPPSPVSGAGRSAFSSRIPRDQEPSAGDSPRGSPAPPPRPHELEQPPPRPPSPAPWGPSPAAQCHVRSSRSYSLPPTPSELRGARGPPPGSSPPWGGRKGRATSLAASCEELPLLAQAGPSLARPHTPVGRVDIAPGGPGRGSRTVPGRPQTPADRYDVRPSEEPCARPPGRFPRSPHPSHCLVWPKTPAEESPAQPSTMLPALGRQPRSRFTDRLYSSQEVPPSRARLHGRLISPHSAASGYIQLPPLPPPASRPQGKRTALGALPRSVAALSQDGTLLLSPGAESNTDVLLTRLCGQDRLLRGLEEETGHLRAEKERLEKALELTRHHLDECRGQDLVQENIWYQQRRLQDELVQVRARLCDLALESERAWGDYTTLGTELQRLRETLAEVRQFGHPQEQVAARQELWMIEDIIVGLGAACGPSPTLHLRTFPGFSLAASPVVERWGDTAQSPLPGPQGGSQRQEPPARPSPAALCPPPQGEPAEGHVPRGDAWGSRPPQSQSPEPDGGRPLRVIDDVVPGLCFSSAAPQLSRTPSPAPPQPWEHQTEEQSGKVIPPDLPGPHRARMSLEEQLERMRRHQEGRRQEEGSGQKPWGPRQGSLRTSASRLTLPAPATSLGPEPSQTDTESLLCGGQTGGLWSQPPPPPPPERDRHRIRTLAYALATEASERTKFITGRTLPEPQLGDSDPNLAPSPELLDVVTNQHLLLTGSPPQGHPEANHLMSEPCNPANQNTAFTAHSGRRAGSATETSSLYHSLPPSEAVNRALSLPDTSLGAGPVPELTNGTLTIQKASSQESTLLWEGQKGCGERAPEQRIVGNKSLANGMCQGREGESPPSRVVAHLGQGSQPIRITLLQSSF
ncbi:pleckstrin homology domain-containing family A member 4 isoform X2 [Carettochelys insculpta]|uniref:pleckstrin homology domain-containing family A member 4 isoform X2 n=1 Tax=Carettochelys insculpta TaxID=44489 RepID=UPI003EC077DE